MAAHTQRQMHLGVFVQAAGHHVSGWRIPGTQYGGENLSLLQHIASTAERGLFDLFFLADGLSTSADAHPSMIVRFEPLTLLSALAMTTRHIGLAATVSTTYGAPYHTARMFASLDHLSNGRAAWNVVTTSYDRSAANFGRTPHPDHDKRYEIAKEFVSVCKGLWDSWDDGAFIADQDSGLFAKPGSMHTLNHDGPHFSVRGPLNVSRTPQGHPVLIQAGSSPAGQSLAAELADIVFTAQDTLESAQKYYTSITTLAKKNKRRVVVMPGIFPIVGRTEAEADASYTRLRALTDMESAYALLSERLGCDARQFDPDQPLPANLPISNALRSRADLLRDLAERDKLTLRDLALHVGMARGHRIVKGTATTIADTLQEWFENGAADGFNIMPPWFPGQFDDFVDLVVPELQRRGLFRHSYHGHTLRDLLGLDRPENSFTSKHSA